MITKDADTELLALLKRQEQKAQQNAATIQGVGKLLLGAAFFCLLVLIINVPEDGHQWSPESGYWLLGVIIFGIIGVYMTGSGKGEA